MPMTRLVVVEVKVIQNGEMCARNWRGFEGQKLTVYRVSASLSEGKKKNSKKKEKSRFLTMSGLVGRRPFLKVRL